MKKSNPLLAKYLSFEHGNMLAQMTPKQIETEYVSKAYNGFGFDFHNKIIPEVQEQLMNDVQPDDWVLDIGCGNGEYRKVLPDTCVYIGIEQCTAMVPVEDEIHMDGTCLAFRTGLFNKVLIIAVLHHLASPERRVYCLQQAWRMLEPEGTLYLTVLNYQSKEQVYESQETILQYCLPKEKVIEKPQLTIQKPRREKRGDVYARYYHLFSKEEIVELLRTAMFQIVDLQEQKENIIIKAKPDQKIH